MIRVSKLMLMIRWALWGVVTLFKNPNHNATMRLTENTLKSEIEHTERILFSDETTQSLAASPPDSTVPKLFFWPSRFAHRVSGADVHLPTGLTFLGKRLISQSGQVGVDSFMEAIRNRVTSPNHRKIRKLDGGEYLALPPIHAYYHWIAEWLPVVLRIREISTQVQILTPPGQPDFVIESLKILGIKFRVASNRWLCVQNLWLVDKTPFGRVHPDDLERVRQFSNLAVSGSSKTRDLVKIYVSRAGFQRAMKNEAELELKLEEKGFIIFRAGGQGDFSSQIELFSSASLILGATGSGLANAMFMPSGGTLVELFSDLVFDTSETVTFYTSIATSFQRIHMNSKEEPPYGDAQFALRKLVESEIL
jgi:hypothetical protein